MRARCLPGPGSGSPAAPSSAATTVSPAVVNASRVQARSDDKLICKTETVLGSRQVKKVCYNQADQAQITQDERMNLERIQTLSDHAH